MWPTRHISLVNVLHKVVPNLKIATEHYKGQHGKVAIFGGSAKYSGAPYFAGLTALKQGYELVYIVCEKEAISTIKSYSPELIVCDVNDEKGWTELIPRMDSVVIGPGLGREFKYLPQVMSNAKLNDIPLVMDADALWILCQQPKQLVPLLTSKTIITPNTIEFKRLFKAVLPNDVLPEDKLLNGEQLSPFITSPDDVPSEKQFVYDPQDDHAGFGSIPSDHKAVQHVAKLASKLGCTVCKKGIVDVISDGTCTLYVNAPAIPRRCGGQGDVLAGSISAFLGWAHNTEAKQVEQGNSDSVLPVAPSILAGFGGSYVVRHAAYTAFQTHRRATLASDVMAQLPSEFERLFPSSS